MCSDVDDIASGFPNVTITLDVSRTKHYIESIPSERCAMTFVDSSLLLRH